MKRPMFTVGISYLAGTLVAVLFLEQLSIFIGILILTIALPCSFVKNSNFKVLSVVLVSIALALGVYYMFYTFTYIPTLSLDSQTGIVEGLVIDKDGDNNKNFVVKANIDGIDKQVKIIVRLASDEDIKVGDKVSFNADFQALQMHYNHNYYYFSNGIFITAYPNSIIQVYRNNSTNIYEHILQLRGNIINLLLANLPKDVASMVIAITMGDRSYLSQEMKQALTNSGAMHLTSVSGMHLVIIVSIVYQLTSYLKLGRKTKIIINILTCLFFMVLTGMAYSITRAGIMMIVMQIGMLIWRSGDRINTWGIAGFIVTITNPFAVVNIGFLMSMLAVLGIILFQQPLFTIIRGRPYQAENSFIEIFADNIFQNLALSLAAHALIIPILAFVFGYIPIIAPITTLLISWIITAIFIILLITLILLTIGIFNSILYIFASLIIVHTRLLISVIICLASLPFSVFYVGDLFVAAWIAMVYIFFAGLFIIKAPTRLKIRSSAGCVAVLLLGFMVNSIVCINTVKLAIFESAVVISEGNNAIIIGEIDNPYLADQINQYLLSNGVDTIDVAIPIEDKSLGYLELLENSQDTKIIISEQNRYLPHIENISNNDNILPFKDANISALSATNISISNQGFKDTIIKIGDSTIIKTNGSYQVMLEYKQDYDLVISQNGEFIFNTNSQIVKTKDIFGNFIFITKY